MVNSLFIAVSPCKLVEFQQPQFTQFNNRLHTLRQQFKVYFIFYWWIGLFYDVWIRSWYNLAALWEPFFSLTFPLKYWIACNYLSSVLSVTTLLPGIRRNTFHLLHDTGGHSMNSTVALLLIGSISLLKLSYLLTIKPTFALVSSLMYRFLASLLTISQVPNRIKIVATEVLASRNTSRLKYSLSIFSSTFIDNINLYFVRGFNVTRDIAPFTITPH